MVTVFALAAALLYGSADFLGGSAARRADPLVVLAVATPLGALVMLGAALVAGGPILLGGLGWAVAGGIVGAFGLIVFYKGLAIGPMSVVAPVSAMVSTLLPVGVALAMGERQHTSVYVGALACVASIVLLSMEGGPRGPSALRNGTMARAAGYGAVSGLAFGLFFLFLRMAGESGVLWPVTAGRLAGTAVMLGAAAWCGAMPHRLVNRPGVLLAASVAGVVDASANLCYVLATRAGLFGMAVILTSLYPGMTVLLARFVLGERMQPVQRLGLLLAAGGVVLVTI
ncbi:MAG TPA: EamA family transporter [Streptosporangiaceae bacterium]|nr:EamA family transporter [Streptosporangiaceae bacterium]